jgi:hypothetical protein
MFSSYLNRTWIGASATHISSGFVGLHFDEIKHYYKCNRDPGCACSFFFRSYRIFVVMKKLRIAGFVEYQHGGKSPAWSGKTTEGQASPPDCHRTAKIMSDG